MILRPFFCKNNPKCNDLCVFDHTFYNKKCVSLDEVYPVHSSDWIIFCPKTFKNAYFG